MGWQGNRSQSVRRTVTLSPEEWEHVESVLRQVHEYRAMSWNEFARRSVMGMSVTRVVLPFDPKRVTKEINKLGVNVNQIAHRVNAQDYATLAQVEETRRLLQQVQDQLHECWELYRSGGN